MRNLYYILQKEFLLILRDKTILRLIFIMPVFQLLLIPLAADYEVKHISIALVDQDHSASSQRLVQKVGASNYFRIAAAPSDYRGAKKLVEEGGVDIVLTIPPNFEKDFLTRGHTSVQLVADAVDGVRAGLGTSYALLMIRQFQMEFGPPSVRPGLSPPVIEVTSTNWYNPHVNYPSFMVPGMLAILITMVGAFLAALNIVQEKESGTIEQINVTPIGKSEFILGKLIPFWLLGMISVTVGIVVARVAFQLWPVGSLLTIYLFSALYLVGILGIGLFISTITDSQQQATLLSFFFMMIFVLLSGLYTPIESMPDWAQSVAAFNPPTYFVTIVRAVYIKGSTVGDMLPALVKLAGFALFFNLLAVWNYRKRSA